MRGRRFGRLGGEKRGRGRERLERRKRELLSQLRERKG
jgi:hypothetical protein